MSLQIDENKRNGVTILQLTGRVVLGEPTLLLRDKIKEVLTDGNWLKQKWGWPIHVVLDLGGVSYVDSAGLGTFVAAYYSARNQGATIKMANIDKRMQELMGITKLATVFEVHLSVDDAVRSFGSANGSMAAGSEN